MKEKENKLNMFYKHYQANLKSTNKIGGEKMQKICKIMSFLQKDNDDDIAWKKIKSFHKLKKYFYQAGYRDAMLKAYNATKNDKEYNVYPKQRIVSELALFGALQNQLRKE